MQLNGTFPRYFNKIKYLNYNIQSVYLRNILIFLEKWFKLLKICFNFFVNSNKLLKILMGKYITALAMTVARDKN